MFREEIELRRGIVEVCEGFLEGTENECLEGNGSGESVEGSGHHQALANPTG